MPKQSLALLQDKEQNTTFQNCESALIAKLYPVFFRTFDLVVAVRSRVPNSSSGESDQQSVGSSPGVDACVLKNYLPTLLHFTTHLLLVLAETRSIGVN